MKTKLLLSFLLSFPFYLLSSQVPQGFNYQAIARDGSGNPIPGQTMQVKLGILSDTIANTMVWEELFNPVKTNAFGLFNIVVGTGVKQSGSAASFSAIDWTKTPLFLRTSIYYPSSWKVMGTSKLQSVPYSMVAGNLEGTVPLLSIKGNTTTMDSALFVVRNNTGQIVFAVYNEGVRIYVDDGKAKGATKGGFAIGSFDKSKGTTSQPLFIVDPDSIRAYIAPNTGKAVKGGFAIGGFDPSKTVLGEEYLRVTRDSSRIYVLNPAKGVKGGFAIGGFDPSKGGLSTTFTSLTPNNYFLGNKSGMHNTSGLYNSFVGYETGINNTSGSQNVLLGYEAGHSNSDGNYNVFIGNQAGYLDSTGSSNVFLGTTAGYYNKASNNVFLGFQSGYYNTAGTTDAFMGYMAGFSNTTGSSNVFVGNQSGFTNFSGSSNIAIGDQAGYSNITGNYNVFLGYKAGYKNNSSMNTFIGYIAGVNNTSGFYNSFFGDSAGYSNTGGMDNTFIGGKAGYSNIYGLYNTFVGAMAGYTTTMGYYNTFLGTSSGYRNTTGNENVMIGLSAGYGNITGLNNVSIGSCAGVSNNGSDNVFIGQRSGNFNNSNNNVFLGFQSGYNNTGSGNIFIGNQAGYNTGPTSDALYIDNTATNSPLIYGVFTAGYKNVKINGYLKVLTSELDSTKFMLNNATQGDKNVLIGLVGDPTYSSLGGLEIVRYAGKDGGSSIQNWGLGSFRFANNQAAPMYFDIQYSTKLAILSNGNVGIGTSAPSQILDVNGNARFRSVGSGAFSYNLNIMSDGTLTTATSDISMKENIYQISDALDKVTRLRGVSFNWKNDSTRMKQIGMIAQEVEPVVPEIVFINPVDGLKGINYSQASALFVEAIKEQQKQIEEQQKEIGSYKSQLQTLQEKVDQIEVLLAKAGVK